ncbi:hypothetical protein HOLleu_17623 [Holothuria leucospilota]|uniref:Uncharacterized protein n=1 Tax=Holothuria leucospilota TaxID=206669 RepID=A0A9Q1C2K4_HOLLE|nr:hypothetical protein HOLleu_17623 [Holothuria leucospilota]
MHAQVRTGTEFRTRVRFSRTLKRVGMHGRSRNRYWPRMGCKGTRPRTEPISDESTRREVT